MEERPTAVRTSGAVALYLQEPTAQLRIRSAPLVGYVTGPELHVFGVLTAQLFGRRQRMDRVDVTQLQGCGVGLNIRRSTLAATVGCNMPAVDGGPFGGLPESNHEGTPIR